MSVSIQEVLEQAGYNIKGDIHDALWLLSQQDEFADLCEQAEDLIEESGE